MLCAAFHGQGSDIVDCFRKPHPRPFSSRRRVPWCDLCSFVYLSLLFHCSITLEFKSYEPIVTFNKNCSKEASLSVRRENEGEAYLRFIITGSFLSQVISPFSYFNRANCIRLRLSSRLFLAAGLSLRRPGCVK